MSHLFVILGNDGSVRVRGHGSEGFAQEDPNER